mmetsp:Transcript_61783/g.177192  ORF Transcript_61783/g.177192 Transcript_61783/m.177192 type:complete len:254 (-) Transcript_61783:241-1002(-)
MSEVRLRTRDVVLHAALELKLPLQQALQERAAEHLSRDVLLDVDLRHLALATLDEQRVELPEAGLQHPLLGHVRELATGQPEHGFLEGAAVPGRAQRRAPRRLLRLLARGAGLGRRRALTSALHRSRSWRCFCDPRACQVFGRQIRSALRGWQRGGSCSRPQRGARRCPDGNRRGIRRVPGNTGGAAAECLKCLLQPAGVGLGRRLLVGAATHGNHGVSEVAVQQRRGEVLHEALLRLRLRSRNGPPSAGRSR